MATSGIARRYAQAVFEIALEENDLDGWLRDLRVIRTVLQEPTLQALLENPAVSFEQKRQVIEDSLSDLGQKRRNLVHLLVENGRVSLIDSLVTAYEALVNQSRGIVHARVTTAVPLTEEEAGEVRHRLQKLTGRTVILSSVVDPTLIGGFVARIGDRLIDTSVVARLAALRARVLV